MTSRSFPFLALLPAAAVLAVLVLGGCGGSAFEGDVKVPDGYVVYHGNGVSFVHPAAWKPTTRMVTRKLTELRFQDPRPKRRGHAAVVLTIDPDVGTSVKTALAGERAVLETVGGAKVTQDEVDVPGARRAFRSRIAIPGNGTGPSHSQTLDLFFAGGRQLVLAAGTPDSQRDALDIDAVIASLRVEQS